MRITGWHIDGYGHFCDEGSTDLPSGLTVLHGPNEAGKSTILSFLRSMLFDLKDRRTADPAIPALAGGRHGGSLALRDAADAQWTLERHRPGGLRLLDGGGTSHDETALARLLGNVNRDVFENVFAFGLQELERLGGLDDAALRDQLFAASLTGGGSSAYSALRRLRDRREALYRQRASSPLKDAHDDLVRLRAERVEAIRGADAYEAVRGREATHRQAVTDYAIRLAELQGAVTRTTRLQELWRVHSHADRLREEQLLLQGTPEVLAPAVDEAHRLLTRIEADRERRQEVTAHIARRGEHSTDDVPDDRLVAIADEVAHVSEDASGQESRIAAHIGLVGDRDRLQDDASTAVEELGPGWSSDSVMKVRVSLPVRREAEAHAEALAFARDELHDAQERLRQATKNAEAESDALLMSNAELEALEIPPAARELELQAEALPTLRSAFQDHAAARHALRGDEETLAGLRALEPRTVRASIATDGIQISILLFAATVAAVLGIALVVLGQVPGGAALIVFAIVVVWADRAHDTDERRVSANDDERAAAAAAHAARVSDVEKRVERGRDVVDREADRLREAAARVGLDLTGLEGLVSIEPVERRAAEITGAREQRNAFDRVVQERQDAHARERASQMALKKERDDTERCSAAVTAAEAAWLSWLDDRGLPADVPAAGAAELLATTDRAQRAVREARNASARADDAQRELTSWTVRAANILEAAGRTPPDLLEQDPLLADHRAVLRALRHLAADTRDASAAAVERGRAAEANATDAAELALLTERITARETSLAQLLEGASVSDVTALERARDTTERRSEVERAIREQEEDLVRIVGAGPEAEALVEEARIGAVGEWEEHVATAKMDVPRITRLRDEAIAAETEARTERLALERSVDLPRIDAEIEQVRTEAADTLSRFRTLLQASELIEHTLEAYVRDQQPAVLREASAWFAQITEGRYIEVRQVVGDTDRAGMAGAALQVVRTGGRAVDPTALSRGTREQLYLCLRLALARSTGEKSTPLPLVMDDVLVNFSPDRSRSVANVIAAVAREQQVLFFTCHPTTRDLLVEAAQQGSSFDAAAVRVEELARRG